MKYLLDTHILLWALQDNPKLNHQARDIIVNLENELIFSVTSIWEVAIKFKKDNQILEPNLFYQLLLQNQYTQLDIKAYHTLAIKELPNIHKDPFDKILIT